MEYLQPSITILGLRIDEPVTSFTDLIVAGICLYAFFQLPAKSSQKTLVYFKWYFLTMCIATAFGGVVGHAFLYALGFSWKLPGWLISMISITVLERAMIAYSKPYLTGNWFKFFSVFNFVELITFAGLAYYFLDFRFVEVHSGYGLVVFVLAFSLYNLKHRKDKTAARYLLTAVAFAALGGLAFMLKLGISQWFNHLDVSHVFLSGAAILFYKASQAMRKELGR
ncbi:MAG: hypothetical protein CL843_13555 [Crocinitomicaceae bacterium]|nr:hypothetical protein [Crocinitomicaceae bacterium]